MQELRYGPMTLSVVSVTPATATRWLELNSANRRLRPRAVEQYARDMASGKWEPKPSAICFDETNRLRNGQHTLSAIVKSGTTQSLLVARGVPIKSIAVMDIGIHRTLNDIGAMLGFDLYSHRSVSVVRVMVFGPADGAQRSFGELFEAYEFHREAVDFACEAPRLPGLSAAVLAVIARAFYSEDHARLKRFVDVLATGISEAHETAAIRLRDFLRGPAYRGASRTIKVEIYNKTQSALRAFLDGRPYTKLYGTAQELFPISDEALP